MVDLRNIDGLLADLQIKGDKLLPRDVPPKMLREINEKLIRVAKKVAGQNRVSFSGNSILSNDDKANLKATFVWLIIDKMKFDEGVVLRAEDISCCVEVKDSFSGRRAGESLYYPKLDLEKFNPVSFEIAVLNNMKTYH